MSPRYPLVEAAGALIAACSFGGINARETLITGGHSPLFIIARFIIPFGVCCILLAVSIIDFDTMEIPDSLNIALLPFAIASVWAFAEITIIERAIGFFIISLPLLITALIIKDAFGGGDIKLMAVCGFLLGWKNALAAFFIAVVAGGAFAAFLLISKRAKRGEKAKMAFGPFLCAGAAAGMFFGRELVEWYLKFYY